MTTTAEWVSGARPRTLPAAVSPVLIGSGAAAAERELRWWAALLALIVALALQVAVNYANDYSDGIRGTDTNRVGPFRLVGSGAASPAAVKRAAFMAFGVAALAGLVLVLATQTYELLLVGAVCIAAAWFYTGGRRPYGYRGLGELSVFVFFGLVAVIGTTYVQTGRVTVAAVVGGIGCGALACAILVVNNLRDIPTDSVTGKRTLAVVLGDQRTRTLYTVLVGTAFVAVFALMFTVTAWAAVAFLSLPLAMGPLRAISSGRLGRELVPALAGTGLLQLAYGALLGAGLAISGVA
ncbi:MAG TPA: 1,4-dihydroxy-2-naphthoate polyprenyltransferase [Acidothermales bacterium]